MTEPLPQEAPAPAEAAPDAGPQQPPQAPSVAPQPRPLPRYAYGPPPPPQAYVPPPPPPAPAHSPAQGRSGKPAITISNLSLFGIVASLLLLGALTFLAGFLVGISMGGTGSQQPATHQSYIVVPSGGGGVSPDTLLPTSSELAGIAGTAANDLVSALPTSFVPHLLQPAASQLRKVTTQHATQATKDVVQDHTQPPSSTTGQAPGATPDHYSVRLGTFVAKDNARDLQKRMQEMRYRTEVHEDKSQPTTVWHVESGKYTTYGDAREAANGLPKDTVPLAIVVKHPADAAAGSGS